MLVIDLSGVESMGLSDLRALWPYVQAAVLEVALQYTGCCKRLFIARPPRGDTQTALRLQIEARSCPPCPHLLEFKHFHPKKIEYPQKNFTHLEFNLENL